MKGLSYPGLVKSLHNGDLSLCSGGRGKVIPVTC